MMSARKAAGLLDLPKDPADNGAQGILDDLVVGDQTFWGLVAHDVRW
jgi:hypothetical protein